MQAFETELKFEELKHYRDVIWFTVRHIALYGADEETLRWVMSAETKQHFESEMNKITRVSKENKKTRLMGVKILIDDELPLGEIKLFVDGGVF